MKQRKSDFVIREDKDERLIFRFYSRKSHVHGHSDKCPKAWKAVYKVYYAYSIMRQWKDSDGNIEYTDVLFNEDCDECSIIDVVPKMLDEYLNDRVPEKTTYFPFGMGTEWTFVYHKEHVDEEYEYFNRPAYIEFILFKWNNVGFRFTLPKDRWVDFRDYINNVLEYMLEHSEPI